MKHLLLILIAAACAFGQGVTQAPGSRSIYVQSTAPSCSTRYLWLDTSTNPSVLKEARACPGSWTAVSGTAASGALSGLTAYAAETEYAVGAVVSYNGSTFVSAQSANSGHTPDPAADTAWWLVVAKKGDDGIGTPGPAGISWQGNYAAGTTYDARDGAYYEGSAFVSLQGSNTGNTPDPAQDTAWWGRVSIKGADGVSGPANYSVTFSAETTKTVTQATHGYLTSNLVGTCWDTTVSPALKVSGYNMTVNTSTLDVTFTFPVAFTGKCVINGTGGGGGGTTYTAGAGLALSGTQFLIDTALVGGRLRGTFSYDFGTVNNAACVAQTFSAPGAATGMSGTFSPNASFPTGVNAQTVKVTATGTVQLEICNLSGSAYPISAGLVYTMLLGADL